jgi:hypothetical protein
MIIETIKAWFNKLFAWWPWWKRASKPEYSQAASSMSKGMTKEQTWRTVMEGPMPQSGVRSIVVEHGAGPNSPEPPPQPFVGDELPERLSSLTKQNEQPAIPHPSPNVVGKDTNILPENMQTISFEHEQQLEFLRYLVQQGVVNEGFAEGQIPMQYQSKRED